jgi:serine/threonine-protein kinase
LIEDLDSRSRARVGSVLDDKWTLEALLGVGGMAAVYSARHRNGARAAVKVLHPDLSRHKDVRERFLREGYAANRVEHGGAVKVLDDDVVSGGPDAGTAYLVMELLEGESLQDRLERGPPIGELEFLRIGESVLDVLEAAHQRGVVHRDLKPENLFLLRDEADGPPPVPSARGRSLPDAAGKLRVKVLDFGLARLLQGQAITSYGLALGTPSFMSPEQAAGRIDEIDGRTDLFALAATGFRVRTGRRIHEGTNAVDLVRKMSTLAAPRIREITPQASEPFARVIDRALEFRREDRYETALAMRQDVQRAIEALDGGVGPTTVAALETPAPAGAPDGSAPSAGPTIELSASDLDVTRPQSDADEESIHIPKRRSIVPWIALLLFGGVGAKLWLDARAARAPVGTHVESPPSVSASAPVSSVSPPSSPDDAAMASAASPSASALPTAPSTPKPQLIAPPPSASASHRAAPSKVGPANLHRLPRKHATGGKGVRQ